MHAPRYSLFGAPAIEIASFFRSGDVGLFASVTNPIGRHTSCNNTAPRRPSIITALPSAPSADRRSATTSFDVKSGFACDANSANKFSFLQNMPSVKECTSACDNETACVEFEYCAGCPDGRRWCALYNASFEPHPNPKFDCGCRGACGVSPPPPPHPHPPGPPSPSPGPPTPFNPSIRAELWGWSEPPAHSVLYQWPSLCFHIVQS